ncbi:DNA adenine methylase [Helicobacter bizzozeronii]|uniref:DNA adenine methylase n=1 Tax=Helicobacter bizzozeronii TaxID=56877 RepID=UPI00131582CE|nr:DNA adenine methylase [Helicobacter bizzozeronii]
MRGQEIDQAKSAQMTQEKARLTLSKAVAKTPSPLRYPGGKSVLGVFVGGLLVQNKRLGAEFAESYAGGAGLGLSLLFGGVISKLHLNDLDPHIYAIWHAILKEPSAFVEKIQRVEVSLEEWHVQKQILQNPPSLFDLGFAAFFLNRTNFSGILRAGPIGGQAQKGKWLIGYHFKRSLLLEKIKRIQAHASNISISNQDALEFMAGLDKSVVFYCDPPYYQMGAQFYSSSYSQETHQELAQFLQTSPNAWLCSYDAHPHIQALYSKSDALELSYRYGASKGKMGREWLFSNLAFEREQSLWD